MRSSYIEKQPDEILPITVSFVDVLPDNETVQGTSSVVTSVDGTVVTGFITDTDISSPEITAVFTGGANGTDYKLQFKAVTQNYTFEYTVFLQVRESAF